MTEKNQGATSEQNRTKQEALFHLNQDINSGTAEALGRILNAVIPSDGGNEILSTNARNLGQSVLYALVERRDNQGLELSLDVLRQHLNLDKCIDVIEDESLTDLTRNSMKTFLSSLDYQDGVPRENQPKSLAEHVGYARSYFGWALMRMIDEERDEVQTFEDRVDVTPAQTIYTMAQKWQSGERIFSIKELALLATETHVAFASIHPDSIVRTDAVIASLDSFIRLCKTYYPKLKSQKLDKNDGRLAFYENEYSYNFDVECRTDDSGNRLSPEIAAEMQIKQLTTSDFINVSTAANLTANLYLLFEAMHDFHITYDQEEASQLISTNLQPMLHAAIAGQKKHRQMFAQDIAPSEFEPLKKEDSVIENDLYIVGIPPILHCPTGMTLCMTLKTTPQVAFKAISLTEINFFDDIFCRALQNDNNSFLLEDPRWPVSVIQMEDGCRFGTQNTTIQITKEQLLSLSLAFNELMANPKVKERRELLTWVFGRI